MLESTAKRSALGAAPGVAVVDVGLNFLSQKTELLNHTNEEKNECPENHLRTRSLFRFCMFDDIYFCDQTKI